LRLRVFLLEAGTPDEALRLAEEHPGEIQLLVRALICSAKSNEMMWVQQGICHSGNAHLLAK
jgi:hypothetical protein